jgi:uncharacterized protein YndB with AHSA1/START domain
MNRPNPRVVTIVPVRRTVRVNADAARAFDVFTAGFARWWPRSHHISPVPMREAIIEPRVGGRWYERGEDGSECEWGKVLAWEPPARVVLAWQINNSFKYDPTAMSEVEIRFVAESAAVTLVELEHRNIDRLGSDADEFRKKVDSPNGWSLIMQTYAAAVAARE